MTLGGFSYLDILKSSVTTKVTIEMCDGVEGSGNVSHGEHVTPETSTASAATSSASPAPASAHLGGRLVT